jgi:predicted nucleic acid-binding protein
VNVYFDTSALVPMVVDEDTTPATTRLWNEAARVISSRLTYAEARAALAKARRIDRLNEVMLRRAVRELQQVMTELEHIEVTPHIVHRAGDLAEALGLRGYDAVHVASAELLGDPDLVLASGDETLLAAARAIGLHTAVLRGA